MVGGMEPDDDADQRELVELWHLSRMLSRDRSERLTWVVNEFLNMHPGAGRKWVYVWCEANLGRLVVHGPTNANPVPSRLSKKRAK